MASPLVASRMRCTRGVASGVECSGSGEAGGGVQGRADRDGPGRRATPRAGRRDPHLHRLRPRPVPFLHVRGLRPPHLTSLTGTAFVGTIEALPRFPRPDRGPGGWLFQIARRPVRPPAQAGPLADRTAGGQPQRGRPGRWGRRPRGAGHRAAGGHPRAGRPARALPDQREVLLLRMAGGLTAPEVAAILGKTTGAVKALQHRGLASLARVLGLQPARMSRRNPRIHPARPPVA